MTSPQEYYEQEQCGELEYELYTEIHNVIREHSEIWATEPRYILMSAVEGLFECYFESQAEMFKAFSMVKQQIVQNSDRPEVNGE